MQKNWLNGQAWRVVISPRKPNWRPAASSMRQDSVLRPVLFNIFAVVWMRGQSILSKFADNAELGGVADTPEGCAGSSKKYVEYLTMHLKIYGNPNRNIILSDDEKEEVFYFKHPNGDVQTEERFRTYQKVTVGKRNRI